MVIVIKDGPSGWIYRICTYSRSRVSSPSWDS